MSGEVAAVVGDDGPLADIEAEAGRLLRRAEEARVDVRLLGGVAVGLHRHRPLPAGLERAYGDIDVVVGRGHDRALKRVLEGLGYVPNRGFNNLHGDRRLLFYDERHGRQLDVFIGVFRMCHVLDLNDRLQLHAQTLSPADLLLTKLQIIRINPKDVIDALVLLLEHETGSERMGDVIDLDRLVQVTCRDWGWYTTFSDNLARLAPAADATLSADTRKELGGRLAAIQHALAAAPKSLPWRARATVGRRVAWYELPEDPGGG